MIVMFPCPSSPFPIGGVAVLYELANGLARRGHEVHVSHGPFFDTAISSLDELSWFDFEPQIQHHMVAADATEPDVPHADVIFGTGAAPQFGLPAQLVQGFDMLDARVERQALRSPGLKVCVAGWLLELAEPLGMTRERFRVVPLGFDRERYKLHTPQEQRSPSVAILYSPHPAKGWSTSLQVLRRVREVLPDVEVSAFGTSDSPEDLPGWIRFRAHPDPDELVKEIYNKAQVMLQSSTYEGFGLTALEAMSCGAALVTTDNGGSREYAVHGETALVAQARDIGALSSHVVSLLQDPDRRTRIARAGTERAQRFDWDCSAAMLEEALEEYLDDPAPFSRPAGEMADVACTDDVGLASWVIERTSTIAPGAADLGTVPS